MLTNVMSNIMSIYISMQGTNGYVGATVPRNTTRSDMTTHIHLYGGQKWLAPHLNDAIRLYVVVFK
jgi:hypothetical protein